MAATLQDAQNHRLMAIGEKTAQFAHQVRTPLASAMLYVGQLDTTTPQQQRTAKKIAARLNDLGRMVNDMLGFAAGAKPSAQIVNVYDLLTDVQVAIAPQIDEETDLLVAVEDNSLRLSVNRDSLKGALLNLVTNAIQACTGRSRIVLGARLHGGSLRLTVTDNGPGIAEQDFPRLFEPFFTTRPQGTGLGLAVVQAVATAHGGTVAAQSSKLGTRFTIRLPLRIVHGEEPGND